MEYSIAIANCSTLSHPPSKRALLPSNSANKLTSLNVSSSSSNNKRRSIIIQPRAIEGAASDLSAPVDISWQIVVGALAGITPFIVAGIEFGKRIIAQKNCEVCGGSGLVSRDDYYIRCPNCGGFLPWQSWKRFFTG